MEDPTHEADEENGLLQRPADHWPHQAKWIYLAQTAPLLTRVMEWAGDNLDQVTDLVAEIDDVNFNEVADEDIQSQMVCHLVDDICDQLHGWVEEIFRAAGWRMREEFASIGLGPGAADHDKS